VLERSVQAAVGDRGDRARRDPQIHLAEAARGAHPDRHRDEVQHEEREHVGLGQLGAAERVLERERREHADRAHRELLQEARDQDALLVPVAQHLTPRAERRARAATEVLGRLAQPRDRPGDAEQRHPREREREQLRGAARVARRAQ